MIQLTKRVLVIGKLLKYPKTSGGKTIPCSIAYILRFSRGKRQGSDYLKAYLKARRLPIPDRLSIDDPVNHSYPEIMALRKIVLATDQIYHIYNRGVEKRPIFLNKRDYKRFMQITNYYRFANCPVKFSQFKIFSQDLRNELLDKLLMQSDKHIEILAFCLMPNHIHFLCKQLKENGISKFISKLSSSYSHYFNTLNQRVGPLFQGNFKAVRIETDEQLVHTSRYIHLNPVSSYLLEFDLLESYDYSSYPEYTGRKDGFCNTEQILSYFRSIQEYKDFVSNQVDYARELEKIKHLILED